MDSHMASIDNVDQDCRGLFGTALAGRLVKMCGTTWGTTHDNLSSLHVLMLIMFNS